MKDRRAAFGVVSIALVLLLCAEGSAAQSTVDADLQARLERVRASIVVVTAESESGQTLPAGTGFFIQQNLIATDTRVISSATRIQVQPAGQERRVDISTHNDFRFVTILTVARADGPPLPVGDSNKVAANDKVFVAHPDGRISEAIVTNIGTPEDSACFQINTPIAASERGGPVFNSKGEVIGVAAQGRDEQSNGIVLPATYLTRLLSVVNGPGVGTGRGGGVGVGPPSLGPGRGEFGDSTSPTTTSASVDVRPVLLNRVQPRYTKQARDNKIQGSVLLRVLVGADGEVKQVRIVRGLPDGLDEEAIASARQLKFRPAMKGGQLVPFWLTMQIEFNLR